MGLAPRILGGLSSFIFRTGSYLFLQWLPGTFAPIWIPFFFTVYSLCAYFNYISLPPSSAKPKTPFSEPEQLVLKNSNNNSRASTPPPTITADQVNEEKKPSFAAVAAAHTENEKPEDVDKVRTVVPAQNGSLKKRAARRKASSSSLSSLASANSLDSPSSPISPRPPTLANSGFSLSSLLTGAPSSSSTINKITFLTNVVLLLAVLDSTWTPVFFMNENDLAFVRVGAVTHNSVKLVARIPPPALDGLLATGEELTLNATTTTDEFFPEETVVETTGAKVAYRPTKPIGKWLVGPEIEVGEESDWTGVATLEGLYASTEYEYRLLLPTLSQTHHPLFPTIHSFTTFPDPALSSPSSPGAGTHYTFVASSCVKPGFPYHGPSAHKEVKGAEYLLKEIENAGLKFMMFLGDLIYVDTPYYAGPKTTKYHKHYRQIISSPAMKAVLEKIPFVTIWDDHEIYNDFSASTPAHDERLLPASTAFDNYFGKANPDPLVPGGHYFSFSYGDSAFFVMDARSYRSANKDDDVEGKTMLGMEQKLIFLDWLAKVNQTSTFKFVVSSTPFLSLWSHSQDTWSAFLTERDELMDVMQWVPNIIVLSGDRHEFAAASIRTTVTEFSTSPLSQFYLPIRTLHQSHNRGATGEDVLLAYLPDGNSKFTTFEVDTRVANLPQVRVKVIIDGQEAWNLTVHGKQLEAKPIASAIGGLGKSLMELLGFKKRSWF